MRFEELGYRIDERLDNWRYKARRFGEKYLGLKPKPLWPSGGLLSTPEVTREALKLFRNSNAFIQNLEDDENLAFGPTLKIRLPADYVAKQFKEVAPDARS